MKIVVFYIQMLFFFIYNLLLLISALYLFSFFPYPKKSLYVSRIFFFLFFFFCSCSVSVIYSMYFDVVWCCIKIACRFVPLHMIFHAVYLWMLSRVRTSHPIMVADMQEYVLEIQILEN